MVKNWTAKKPVADVLPAKGATLSSQPLTTRKRVAGSKSKFVTQPNRSCPRLITGTKMKNDTLQKYQDKFGADHPSPITTTALGTSINHPFQPPSQYHLVKSSRMKPESDKHYGVLDVTFFNIVVLVLNAWLCVKDLISLSLVNRKLRRVTKEVHRLLKIDWRPLKDDRLNYENQSHIDPHRVDMATALAVRTGLDPGRIVRTLNGEYTGARRDIKRVLEAVSPVVSRKDYGHIERILTQGCPYSLEFQEETSSKLQAIARGNQKGFTQNLPIVKKTMNKEDRYSHLIPMHDWVCELGPHLRHNSQGMVVKQGSNPRQVWDGSTMYTPMDIVMNDMTPTENEAEITFGLAKVFFYQYVYNLRISFPYAVIFLALADIKACFRFPRIHPDLTGAFGFLADNLYCLATAMVFGSNTSASSWEPFRRAIEGLSVSFANRPDLVKKHKHYLDMIKWEIPSSANKPPSKAVRCELNPGVFDLLGMQIFQASQIWVDDAMIAAVGFLAMQMALAAIIEAIFTVMGEPDVKLRQCHLAMDKWANLIVAEHQLALGLILNTRKLSVAITPKYLSETLLILQTTWRKNVRKRFFALEASKMVGKIARLAEGAPWVRYLVSHLYTSIAFALSQNKLFLESSSREFQLLAKKIKSNDFKFESSRDHGRVVRFALKKAAKMVHHCSREYNIVPSMREELDFLEQSLQPNSGVIWEAPIAFLIKRMPSASTWGDACLEAGGGYSLNLKFWYHVQFPDEIIRRTLKHLPNNEDKKLISINVLEFLIVIINYCGAWTVFGSENVTEDPHPILLNGVDNMSANSWTVHTCKGSRLGKLLAKFFCFLLMDATLGVNSKWISTTDNFIADEISRIKKSNSTSSQHFSFDYSTLPQKYPELKNCRFFQPSPDLLSLLWDILLQEKLPSLRQVRALKQSGLGKLIS